MLTAKQRTTEILFLCLLLLLLARTATLTPCQNVRVHRHIVLETEGIAPHAADMMGTLAAPHGFVETRIDIYRCADSKSAQSPAAIRRDQTLIIFAAAGPLMAAGNATKAAGTQALTTFGTQLAEQGFLVVMAEKRNLMMSQVSTFLSLDFLRVIEYMRSGAWSNEKDLVDIQEVVIGGHSLGGAMAGYAITQICPAVFCPPQPWDVEAMKANPAAFLQKTPYQFSDDDLVTFSFVKASFWYGSTAFMVATSPTENEDEEEQAVLDPTLKGGSGVPLLMILGAGEGNYLGDDQRGWKTYEQWDEGDNGNAKAFLVIEGLDHNGITDFPITDKQNTIVSNLPVESRAKLVVDSVVVWTDIVMLDDDDEGESSDHSELDDFCQDVIHALGVRNVEFCVPEVDDDKNDLARLGLQVGIPVAAFGLLMVLFLGMFLRENRSTRTRVSHHDEINSPSITPATTNKDIAV